jgi:hypothetical protein
MLPADDLNAPDFVAAQFPDFAGTSTERRRNLSITVRT